ncbi:MAG: hypothetical protein KJ077_32795 [Anaerolineae bacterium]|nr:hypothetical protein [Anaerolineae bacterium]
MSEPTTISFVGTTELKAMLEQWAREDDRSISYVMRQILIREAQRRMQAQRSDLKPITQQTH